MKLKETLRRHDGAKAPGGLKAVLGDSYLLRENPMYRRTRDLARAAGFRFVPAWDSYRRAPLFELGAILRKKTIPYNETVPTLRRLAREHGVDDPMEDVPVNLTGYQFHESAHGICDAAFASFRPRGGREKILIALLGESYANATESMAVTFVDDDVHRFFFEQNSYLYADERRTRERRRAARAWGAEGLFRLLWLSYLYSNFLVDDLKRSELEGVLRFALGKPALTKTDVALGTALFRDAYELNPDFRLKTARLFLRLLGVKGDVRRLLDFDFSGVFFGRGDLHGRFDELARRTATRRDRPGTATRSRAWS